MNEQPMTPLQTLFFWLVYTISLLIIHPLLFAYRWAAFIFSNVWAMGRAVWRLVRG